MNDQDLASLISLLTQAIAEADSRRDHAFENDDPLRTRKWLTRRDTLREARSVANSWMSDLLLMDSYGKES